MTTSQPMIEAINLTKFYGEKKAIDNVSFNLNRGEILGFLGPNGAGKTTTMKILTCFISPSSGTARVKGHDVFDESLEARKRIGYLPESAPLYKEMNVVEDLQFMAEMRGIPGSKREQAIRRVINVCGLGEVLGCDIRELSKGYRQRVGLAQAMIHDPDILILDEPTSGLDPNQIVEIRGLIKELGKDKTIILSTHNLSEVKATCSRLIIINRGKLAADGTVEELSQKQEERRYTLITTRDSLAEARSAVEVLGDVTRTDVDDQAEANEVALNVFTESNKDLCAELSQTIVNAGIPLLGLTRQELNLEEVFRGLTLATDSNVLSKQEEQNKHKEQDKEEGVK